MKRLLVAPALLISAPAFGGILMMLGAGPQTAAPSGCSFSRIDFTTLSISPATIARTCTNCNATVINSSGYLATVANDTARFNYTTGGVLLGLLVEPAATNLFQYSNNFTTGAAMRSPWQVTNGTYASFTAAAYTGPDNTSSGWSWTGNFTQLYQQQSITNGVVYTMSWWLRNGTSNITAARFDVNGTYGAVTSATSSFVRYEKTVTYGGSTGTQSVKLNMFQNVSGLVGFYGAQFETGSAASSYIETTGAAAGARGADTVTFTQPAGCGQNTYTFDDNSTQTVSQAAGTATIPTNLTRRNIKYLDGSA